MHIKHLTLVPQPDHVGCNLVPTLDPTAHRKLFWRLYLDWMADASADDADQLERALTPHAHHVRPLIEAITDAMNGDPGAMPSSLLAALAEGGWSPAAAQPGRSAA